MVINSIQYGIKQSIVNLLALLTAPVPVELLAESKFAVSQGIATALNNSLNRWQQLDALITIPWKESQTCN